MPSGNKIGQKVADFQTGNTRTPLADDVIEIFFHAEMSFEMGGQTKRHSPSQETDKPSVARDPGKAYREKNRGRRALDGVAKGSKENPSGRKRN